MSLLSDWQDYRPRISAENKCLAPPEHRFYFTDDIDAVVPVWTRYQWGLPNTVIQYLTVDRGPAATPFAGTTLMAFTYGRGVYAIKLPTGGASFPIH